MSQSVLNVWRLMNLYPDRKHLCSPHKHCELAEVVRTINMLANWVLLSKYSTVVFSPGNKQFMVHLKGLLGLLCLY